jgi:hypothetical protein
MGTLECHWPGVGRVDELEDVGAFWFITTKKGSLLNYRPRKHPRLLHSLEGADHVVPKDLKGWALFGPDGAPWCGIDQSNTLEDLELQTNRAKQHRQRSSRGMVD